MANSSGHHLVLIPGLDGSGHLFEPLINVLPSTFEVSVVRFPVDRPISHREMLGCIRAVIPWDHPYVIVAESSSGPLALKFVQAQRQDIRAVVLCASFVSNPIASDSTSTNPLKWATSLLSKPWYEKPFTPELVRDHLLGGDAPQHLVERTTESLRTLKPEVWSSRIQTVLNADAREELMACEKPILYLQATEDRFVGNAAFDEIRRIKPSVKAASIKGPHAVLQRNPREAFEAIRAFLDSLPAR
jgi:alpha-beta hydrolase superfamily lysophospholipase